MSLDKEALLLAQVLQERLNSLACGKVLVIGDVMLDCYLVGDALRISPEAPVPVVKVEETRRLLGGAGNVARNIAALGGHSALVGFSGDDSNGIMLRALLEDAGVEPHLAICATRPTTVKTRVLARNQQMIRLDQEETSPLSPAEHQKLLDNIAVLLPQYDVVIVSDYGKGLVTKRLLPDLIRIAEHNEKEGGHATRPKILVDPKPQNKAFYHGAYLLTPNVKETSEAAGMLTIHRQDILAAGRHLQKALGAEHVLTTLGADGMALFSEGEPVWHVATAARQVFDVTGAGDTVIATIGLALSAGFSLLEACVLANYAAGIVVGKVGAATASLVELAAVITEFPPDMERWE